MSCEICDADVDFFVDEGPNRTGKYHCGAPIFFTDKFADGTASLCAAGVLNGQ